MAGARVVRDVRSFPTTTRGLVALADWLRDAGCTQVAMESTSVYWKPVWHVLEGEFELVLANAAHTRNVPGRKSDVNDATWIADLLAHGLICSSFVPPEPIQELSDLTRTRKQLVREAVQHKQRIQKVLEDANVKLDSVVSDVLGASGRRMLRAMIAGEQDPDKLAALASEQLSASRETLAEALHGRVTRHHWLPSQAASGHGRASGKDRGRVRSADRGCAPTLSRGHRTTRDHPGSGCDGSEHDPGRDRRGHEALPDRRAPDLVGGLVPGTEPERGQSEVADPAQRRAMAQDHAGAVGLGRQPQARWLSALAVSQDQVAARTQEGDHGGGGFDSNCRLPPKSNHTTLVHSGRKL
jgi:hypothetical protein